jgi:hypothetical protein
MLSSERCFEEKRSSLRNLLMFETIGLAKTCALSGTVSNSSSLFRRTLQGYIDPCAQVRAIFTCVQNVSLPSTCPTKTIYTLSPEFRHRRDVRRCLKRAPENSTLNSDDSTRTSPTLLRRTADWRDHDAWQVFVARYDPLIQSWCRECRLDNDIAGDVSQLFWIELADKMRSFRYDPSRRFRGWLRS